VDGAVAGVAEKLRHWVVSLNSRDGFPLL